jgi:hypothetical protein
MTPFAIRFVRTALAVAAFAIAIPAHAVVGGTLDPNTDLTFGGVASLTRASGGTFSAVSIDRSTPSPQGMWLLAVRRRPGPSTSMREVP